MSARTATVRRKSAMVPLFVLLLLFQPPTGVVSKLLLDESFACADMGVPTALVAFEYAYCAPPGATTGAVRDFAIAASDREDGGFAQLLNGSLAASRPEGTAVRFPFTAAAQQAWLDAKPFLDATRRGQARDRRISSCAPRSGGTATWAPFPLGHPDKVEQAPTRAE